MKRRLSFGLIAMVVAGLVLVGLVSRAPVGHTYAAASTPPPPTATVPPPPPPPVIATSTPLPTATPLPPTATPTSPPPTPTPTPKPSPTKAPKPTATPTSPPPPVVPTPIPTAKIVPTTGAGGTFRLPAGRTTISRSSSAPASTTNAPGALPRTGGGAGEPASPLLPLALSATVVIGAVLRRMSRKL